ncbi:MAG: hypothetical protein NT166_30060 [Candidatus Aminicenantes bacterium]|nr:hypothetical protein [Candidatus Aminicenantes bacterium]
MGFHCHLLLLSPFVPRQKHITGERAQYRNLFVAALAKEIYIFHAVAVSKTMTLFQQPLAWGKPVRAFLHPVNAHLITAGAQAIR